MSKPKVSMIGHRAAVLEFNKEGETTMIGAALSSDTPVRIAPGITEVLQHNESAIDMSRAVNGLPLTVGHSERDPFNPSLPVGRFRNATIGADGKMRGDLDFDTDEQSQAVRGKLERGFADLSVTYSRMKWEGPDASGQITVTRWMPTAASVVSSPADPHVGIGRDDSLQEAVMPKEKTLEAEPASIIDRAKARRQVGHEAGVQAEQSRQNEIASVTAQLSRAQPHLADDLTALAEEAREDATITVDRYRSLALELFGLSAEPAAPADPKTPERAARHVPAGDNRRELVVAGADHSDKAYRGLELALFQRAGGVVDAKDMEGNQYAGWSCMDMAREAIEIAGGSSRGMSSDQIARVAFLGSRAISPGTANYITSQFANITANVITKLLIQGYSEAPVTWSTWASSREVPDFKQFTIPRLSAVDDLPVVNENAAYTNLSRAEGAEAATLVKHGGLFSLSWELWQNDDLQAFRDQAVALGAAAARTVDKKVYAVLTDNNNMGDGNPLFDAVNHSNTGTNALDTDGVIASRVAMNRQTDDQSEEYYAELSYILVPVELRDKAEELAGAEWIPWPDSAGSEATRRLNTIRNTFVPVSTTRLTDATDWYAADRVNTVEVAFLQGNTQPALFREEGWDVDAVHWKIRHPSVAYPKNWRGLYRNVVAG